MTLAELYDQIGGNYERALQIMKKEKLINKYLLKLGSSGVYESLMAAGENMDPTQLFESAHAMRGVCGNLGLDELFEATGQITEEFRPGRQRAYSDEEVKAMIARVDELYRKTAEGIRQYEEGMRQDMR